MDLTQWLRKLRGAKSKGVVPVPDAGLDVILSRARGGPSVKLVEPQDAVFRAACLGVVVMRGEFELLALSKVLDEFGAENRELILSEHKTWSDELNQWLREHRLWDALSANESEGLLRPFGSLSEEEAKCFSGRTESLHIVLWALKRLPKIMPFDCRAEQLPVVKEARRTSPMLNSAEEAVLRPSVEIEFIRRVAELWLWRARTEILQRGPQGKSLYPGDSFDRIVKDAAEEFSASGHKMARSDVAACGKAFRKLKDADVEALKEIASQRLHALNWLCGYGKDWDSVPLST